MPRKARESISKSLAERGHHENWATEDEAAALSGMTTDQFAKVISALESVGFPKPNPWNNKRFIGSINAFWASDAARRWSIDERAIEIAKENWTTVAKGRRASRQD